MQKARFGRVLCINTYYIIFRINTYYVLLFPVLYPYLGYKQSFAGFRKKDRLAADSCTLIAEGNWRGYSALQSVSRWR